MIGDRLAGMTLAFAGDEFYTRKQRLVDATAPMIAEMGLDADSLLDLIQRAEKASYLNAHVPSHAYYLLAIAVTREFRGRAIGATLLERVIDKARKGGFAQVQLDVLADNPAVDFYLAFGFRVLVEIRSPELSDLAQFPSELRMAKEL